MQLKTILPYLADVRLTVDDCTLLAEVLDTWRVASQDRETDIQRADTRADTLAAAFSAIAIAAHALYEYGPPYIEIRPQHRV